MNWGWFGFPCQDVSSLNNSSHQNSQVIAEGSLRTGSVFKASTEYAARNPALELLFAENVLGLARKAKSILLQSNLECCLYRLKNEAGMYTYAFKLCPSMFGKPVSSGRIRMTAIPMSIAQYVPLDQLDQKAIQILNLVIESAATSEAGQDLDFHLVQDTHPCILKHFRDLEEADLIDVGGKRRRIGGTEEFKWRQRHELFCKSHGRSWEQQSVSGQDIFEMFPGMRELPAREINVVACRGLQIPTRTPGVLDVSQNIDRMSEHVERKVWVRDSPYAQLARASRKTNTWSRGLSPAGPPFWRIAA